MTLRIRNWGTWQSYRSDRGQPPWIKVHRRLMSDINWIELTDAERGQLVSLWILAADRDGILPDNPASIRKVCQLSGPLHLETLINRGFLECDVTLTSERRQGDALGQSRSEKVRVDNTADAARRPQAYSEGFERLWQGIQPYKAYAPSGNWGSKRRAYAEYPAFVTIAKGKGTDEDDAIDQCIRVVARQAGEKADYERSGQRPKPFQDFERYLKNRRFED